MVVSRCGIGDEESGGALQWRWASGSRGRNRCSSRRIDCRSRRAIPFYQTLNALLAEAGFDRWIEQRCRRITNRTRRAASRALPPGVYFRMLLVGYFEGIDSQRGIAWRCADSLSLRQFLGIPLDEGTPDHSTLTNTRKRLPPEVFEEVFQFVLGIAGGEEAARRARRWAWTARRWRPTRR